MTDQQEWIISVDDHVLEPPHVWEGRLPARFDAQRPRIIRDEQGEAWFFDGVRRPTTGLTAVAGKKAEEFSPEPVTYEEMRPGCYDPVERVKDMDLDGVLASLCFPSFPRFCGQIFSEIDDKELGLVCLQAYNDWMIEDWCGTVPGRLIPLMVIPFWDTALAVAEIERCAGNGAKAIAFSENPSKLGWPSIHDRHRYWDPVFAASQETGLPLCAHIGSSSQFPQTSPDAPPFVSFTVGPLSNAAQALGDWLWSGNFERFPGLKLCLSEGSIGWIPYVLERASQVFEKQRHWALGKEVERDPWTGSLVLKAGSAREGVEARHPRELFRDHVYGCFFEDAHGVKNIDDIGVDNVMIETDYPHSDSTWPHSLEQAHKVLAGHPVETVHKVLQGNAMRVLNFTPAAVPGTSLATSG